MDDWKDTNRFYWIIQATNAIDRYVTGAEAHRIERELFAIDWEETRDSDSEMIAMCKLTIERIEKTYAALPIAA